MATVHAAGDRTTADPCHIHEFKSLADLLGMPESERCRVLGMTPRQWAECSKPGAEGGIAPHQLRRMSYAIGLMRRAAANLAAPVA